MTGIERRKFLALGLAGCTALGSSRLAWAAPAQSKRRLVFILQRGAADGLGSIAPIGDPDFARLRGALSEDYQNAHRLDGFFSLHPALKRSAELYASGEFLPVHAVASAYRARSHFDGQNLLETGANAPYARDDGWLNRLLGLLPADASGLAISPVLPPALLGTNKATSYAPSGLPDPSEDFLARIDRLYQSDERLHALWQKSEETRRLTDGIDAKSTRRGAEAGALAASLLSANDGPRIAMIETSGWDTHYGQPVRLPRELANLDALIGALKDGLAQHWSDTLVVVATEFGRTAAANGTKGTDHGTASAAMLLGGTVRGGRVQADWPGLRNQDLFESRDLAPTASLEGTIAGAIAGHFALDPDLVSRTLFAHAESTDPAQFVR